MEDRYFKINAVETKAIKIKANAETLVKNEGIQGYALMWLNLTNNQKANKQELLKIYNDYDNGIYVVVDPDEKNVEAIEDYLQRLGLDIEWKEEIMIVQTDEVFNDDDLDVELIDW